MRNKFVLLAALAVIIGLVIGCGSSSAAVYFENKGTFGQQVQTPAKDFESKGLVFVEVQFVTTAKNIEGEIFTYQALLKEAQKVGADAIINVVIDKKIEESTSGLTTNQQDTWYGSALAIRFTTTLKKSTTTVNSTGTTTTTTTAEEVYLNSGGSAGQSSGGASASNEQSGGGGALGRLFAKK